MQELLELLKNPLVWKLLIGYWTFTALVGSLPSPEKVSVYTKSGVALLIYGTIFGFLHIIAGTITRAALAFKVPGAQAEAPIVPDPQKP